MSTINVMFEICNKYNKLLCKLEIINVHSDSILTQILELNSECQNLLNSFHKTNKFLFAILQQINNEGVRLPSLKLYIC